MPESTRSGLDLVLFVLLLAFLVWVPMPFGSASDASQLPLIIPSLLICALAALVRATRSSPFTLTRPGRIWAVGGVLFVAVIGFQLIPMPLPVLRVLSPQSASIWDRATRLASLGGMAVTALHPITVDPSMTALHFFRVLAYFATFLASMILVRDTLRRTIMAFVLAAVAVFEAFYAVNQATLGTYAVWGWKNTLIFGRATGTFVNPNHFGNYSAILLPMALYLSAYAWHTAAPAGALFSRRFVKLVETRLIPFSCGLLAAAACVVGVLVSESRGAVLAIIAGFALVGGMASSGRRAVLRGVLIAVAVTAAIVITILVMGRTETVNRLAQSRSEQLDSRRASVLGAVRIWEMFPLFGSGAGTYQDVVPMTRATSTEVLANHAHDDYAEILATAGAVGFIVSFVALLGGFAALARKTFGEPTVPISWRHRAFNAAALTSIAIAMIHALVDFNFFIPANPITLAAIAGAAIGAREP
ncbi:MAG TPA: O-antigen ligase family protein [Thermoanaerobaculia bacterium]|jgi:O-antigen ligase|nr:O-antigen ligase family protein [Thermoanaerobaculia bacterium]